MQEGPIIVAIDIEGRGPSAIRNGIVSIGVCLGRLDGTVIGKYRWDLAPYPEQKMDSKCMDEFWSKQGDLLDTLQANPSPPSVAIGSLRAFLDAQSYELYLVADMPAYDFGFINYYLDREGLPLLQFDKQGSFRPLHDADSYARGACAYGFKKPWISNADALNQLYPGRVPVVQRGRAHMPEDDAENIFLTHVAVTKKVAK